MNWSRALALLALGACTGNETNVNQVYPDLTVTPTAVDFGEVAALYTQSAQVQVINSGLAVLEVESVRIDGADASVFSVDQAGPLSLKKDEQATLLVQFAPDTYLPFAATLVIESNDEENPTLEVPLTGTGVYAPTPDITVTPTTLDFGDVAPPGLAYETVTIRNDGGASLTLGAIEQTGSGAFTLVGDDPSGFNIPAGQSYSLVFLYTPSTTEGDNGAYRIPSDDPDEPETLLTLLGNGGGDFEYPEAIIDCPSPVEPRTIVTLDGSASTDPDGLALTYDWQLDSVPAGSAVEDLYDATLPVSYINTDIAGEYVVSLVVTNSAGISSARRTCKMDAVPTEQFHVELSWSTGAADLDLHVLDTTGSFFKTPGDCTYCNQVPDWGIPLEVVDDPSLDLDDRYGYGPENINIDEPVAGTYTVIAHYFNDNGDTETVATVRVYAYGVLVGEVSRAMNRNYVWEVGQVNWPDGTFGVLDDYRYNYVYDDAGNEVDADGNGYADAGPKSCSAE